MTSATTVCRAVGMFENSEGRVVIQNILKINVFLLFLPKFEGDDQALALFGSDGTGVWRIYDHAHMAYL